MMTNDERKAKNREASRRYRNKYPERVRDNIRRYKERHPDRQKESVRRYRIKYPNSVRNSDLKSTYGITHDEYLRLLDNQGGHCAICDRSSNGKAALAIDHDHKTGRIRGLLCWQHNSLLGHINDDISQLYKLIWYLNQPTIDIDSIMGERLPSPGKHGRRYPRESAKNRSEVSKRYRLRHADIIKEQMLIRKYGITQSCYNTILINQGGHCAVCDRTISENGKPLCVDHNHVTNKIRGLLCWRHNLILGFVEDDITQLTQLITYLEKQSTQPTIV